LAFNTELDDFLDGLHQGFIRKKEASSWTPLLSGVLLCSAFLLIPYNPYRHLWWLAFVIDWGSLPGIVTTIFIMAFEPKEH